MRKGDVVKRRDEIGPLTDAQRQELRALAELPDEAIDHSDIPPPSDAQLARIVRGRFYRPLKRQLTTRLDADVLDWLKSKGPGYQTRLNAILRAAMLRGE